MQSKSHLILLSTLIIFSACSSKPAEVSETPISNQTEEVIMAEEIKELFKEDIVVGEGQEAKIGDTVSVHYTGTLTDGSKFDSSVDRDTPFEFTLGENMVIQGWEQGVLGMKVGGKRKLTIPSKLGYGPSGRPPIIPPSATLIFDIELLDIPSSNN